MVEHPGTITVIDGLTDDVLKVERIEDVPEAARFVGGVPVVRVVLFTEGDRRIRHEYGPAHELLRTSRQVKSA